MIIVTKLKQKNSFSILVTRYRLKKNSQKRIKSASIKRIKLLRNFSPMTQSGLRYIRPGLLSEMSGRKSRDCLLRRGISFLNSTKQVSI
ncbi:hypothetical protein B6259_07160 [Ruminococcaceae bacterium CPB6]|nr:hypothetical protein B6259_07160 [Ruminococcaceae bacterium CPB6]